MDDHPYHVLAAGAVISSHITAQCSVGSHCRMHGLCISHDADMACATSLLPCCFSAALDSQRVTASSSHCSPSCSPSFVCPEPERQCIASACTCWIRVLHLWRQRTREGQTILCYTATKLQAPSRSVPPMTTDPKPMPCQCRACCLHFRPSGHSSDPLTAICMQCL